jgi:serine/threonine protein kinase
MPESEVHMRAQLFYEEMRIMALISSHANVMRLAGFSNSQQSPFDLALVTDFMVNTDLTHALNDAELTLSPTRIMAIIAGISCGLTHIHAHDVIHRDIAARNVFMDRNFSPRIGDFGMAMRSNDAAVLECVPDCKWLSPEAIRDRYYCVPVADHQLLTDRGFLYLDEVLAAVDHCITPRGSVEVHDWCGLRVASFDAASRALVYEQPTALALKPHIGAAGALSQRRR